MPVETRGFTNTRDSERWPYAVSCSAVGCHFHVCAGSKEDADEVLLKHETNGPCPFGAKEASKGMPVGKSLREMQWDMMDEAVDKAVTPGVDPAEKERLKGEITGIAKCIFLMDQPYWKSVSDVEREGAERLKMRRGQIKERPTPGCQIPHSVQELGARTAVAASAKPAATRHPVDSKIEALDDGTLARLLKGVRAGLDVDFIAETYGVELAVVRRIAAQPDRFARTGS